MIERPTRDLDTPPLLVAKDYDSNIYVIRTDLGMISRLSPATDTSGSRPLMVWCVAPMDSKTFDVCKCQAIQTLARLGEPLLPNQEAEAVRFDVAIIPTSSNAQKTALRLLSCPPELNDRSHWIIAPEAGYIWRILSIYETGVVLDAGRQLWETGRSPQADDLSHIANAALVI